MFFSFVKYSILAALFTTINWSCEESCQRGNVTLGYTPNVPVIVDSLNPALLWEEPELFRQFSGTEIFRLHWYCCINFERFIKLSRRNDKVWLEAKEIGIFINPLTQQRTNHQLGPGGNYDVVCFKKQLSLPDWQSFDSLLTAKKFWQMSASDSLYYIDGYHFDLAAHLSDRYHAVCRDTPEGEFKEVCLHLIHLAGYKDEWAPPFGH